MENLVKFFEEYATASMNKNASGVAKFYAQNFIVAEKTQSLNYKNDEKFIEWLNEVFKFNQKVGLERMQVKKVESNKLGEDFCSATVTWSAIFSTKPTEEINFDIHYILNRIGASYKIILYINEENQEELMKEKGVL